MSTRRFEPIKVGARKTLRFMFVDANNDALPMASGTITIWDPKTGEKLVTDVAVTVVSNVLEYEWTAPAISGSVRKCKVEFKGIELVGSEPRKSGSDGNGDYEIDIVASQTA